MSSEPHDDARFMPRAMAPAREGDRKPGANPIGCVILLDGEIVGEEFNEVDSCHDPNRARRDRRDAAGGRDAAAIRFPRRDALLDVAALRDVHDGLDLAKIGRIVYGAERH
jgi:tRNA(adenine34) deaminase